MKLIAFLTLLPLSLDAATCCLGGGPKSFISLQRLERYQIGVSSGVRDVFGEYDIYGFVGEAPKNTTATVSFGAGFRVTDELQLSANIPVIHQRNSLGRGTVTRTNLGDTFVGAEYLLLESLFQSDPYPTISVLAGVKFPSGTVDSSSSGMLRGTGNGLWEPSAGLQIQKSFNPLSVALRGTFAKRIPTARILDHEGDLFELTESATYAFTQQFALGGGLNQSWTRAAIRNRETIPDTHSRLLSAFANATYFLNRYWSVTLAGESALTVEGWGMNRPVYRSVTLTTRYGFF